MNDLARHIFNMGTSLNRAYTDALAMHQPRIVVQIPALTTVGVTAEPLSFPRCHADVFDADTLTITSMDGLTVREFGAGEWLDATAYGADGHIRYSLRPKAERLS